jgi:hypothetical protein
MSAPVPLRNFQIVVPAGGSIERVLAARSAQPFAPERLAFVHALGRAIMNSREARALPELVALGFWARPASVQQMIPLADDADLIRLARGLAFHIAPANVDTIFVYSLLLSVLAGNRNIVRISTKESEQTGLLLRLIGEVLAEADPATRESLAIVRYGADRATNDYLSLLCDLRLVWAATQRSPPCGKARSRPRHRLNFPNKLSGAGDRRGGVAGDG